MLASAPKSGLILPSALLCGALFTGAFLFAGCTESSKTAPAPANNAAATAPANPATKVADATAKKAAEATAKVAEAGNKAAEATKAAAEKTAAAAGDAAKKATEAAQDVAAKAKETAKPVVDAAKDVAAKVAPTPAEEKAKAMAAEAAKAAPQKIDQAAMDKAAMEAKAKMAAAGEQKGVDPLSQDVDPNSKARLTYEFGSDTKNFGKVMQGDVLTHKFNLQSSGEEDLVIKQAKPTCGCTVAQIMVEENGAFVPYQFGKVIPPGKKVEIGATLHTQNKRGHAGSKINIFTNDPRGQTILSLEAEVDPFFQVNPASINFNQMSAKDKATDKMTVSTTKGDRVKLTAIKDNMPQGLSVEVNPLDADPDGKATRFEVVVTAGPGLTEGNLAYSLPLRSDAPIPGGEKMPNGQAPSYEISATIMARVTGAISYNPAFVSLGLIRPGQTLSRSVRITSHDPEFKLTDAKVAIQGRDTVDWEFAKYFTPVVRPVAGENSIDVEVTLNGMPESLAGSFSGTLLVQIGHPEKPEIKLPITGVCRGGSAGGPPAQAPTPTTTPIPVGNTPK